MDTSWFKLKESPQLLAGKIFKPLTVGIITCNCTDLLGIFLFKIGHNRYLRLKFSFQFCFTELQQYDNPLKVPLDKLNQIIYMFAFCYEIHSCVLVYRPSLEASWHSAEKFAICIYGDLSARSLVSTVYIVYAAKWLNMYSFFRILQ